MLNRRVLIIDDSITIRAMIEQLFQMRNDMRVVAVAGGADAAWEALNRFHPDVITLDLSMPGMNGAEFLDRVMREHPMPVVVVSSSSQAGNELCAHLLSRGAAACFDKAHILSRSKDFLRLVRSAKRGAPLPC